MNNSTLHPRTPNRGPKSSWILVGLGLIHLPLVAGHIAFPWVFHWSHELPRLSADNAGLLWCLHLCAVFWLASMGAITLVDGIRRRKGLPSRVPKILWLWMAGFYGFRMAVEVPCFGATANGIVVMAIVGAMAGLYFAAWSSLDPVPAEDAVSIWARRRPRGLLR